MSFYDLSTSEYLSTPKGQLSRYMWRKMRGRSYYIFDREPPGRSTRRNVKAGFQREILKQMIKQRRRSYRSRIAAEIWLDPTSENPPHIHTAVKKLLDIFAEPISNSGIKRNRLIYRDDKQIAYLSVRYYLGAEKSRITATFAPFRDFLEDLKLAYDIISGKYDDSINRYDFERKLESIERINVNRNLSDAMQGLKELEADKDKYIALLSREAYDAMLLMKIIDAQEYLLSMAKLSVRDVYGIYNTSKIFQDDKKIRDMYKTVSGWITDSPIRIQFPNLPIRDNEKEPFKDEIRKSLKNFKKRFSILEPLYIPVTMQVIYKPPIASESFYKDLDNILRDFILPAFNEEFEPPAGFITKLASVGNDGRLRKVVEQVPKSVQYSILGYQVIEVPRHHEDKDDGILVAGFSPSLHLGTSIWWQIDEIIEKWVGCCDDL